MCSPQIYSFTMPYIFNMYFSETLHVLSIYFSHILLIYIRYNLSNNIVNFRNRSYCYFNKGFILIKKNNFYEIFFYVFVCNILKYQFFFPPRLSKILIYFENEFQ